MKKIIYASNQDLPKNIQALPDEAQTLFRETIHKLWPDCQNIAQVTKGAWEEVKKHFKKKGDGYWYKREHSTND